MRSGLPSLRDPAFVAEWKRSLAEIGDRRGFRVVHQALRNQHVQLIVEVTGKQTLIRGMKSVGARLGRAVNRTFGRSGPALDGRYEVQALRTPEQVRRAVRWSPPDPTKPLASTAMKPGA